MPVLKCNDCSSNFKLGCIGHCETLTTALLANAAGVFQLHFSFLGIVKTVETTIANIGDPIIINGNDLNETGTTYLSITDPNGQQYTHTDNAVGYTCFEIETFISLK